MTKQHSISTLRQRMLDDMTMRRLQPKTQASYVRAVKNFTRFFGRSPDLAGPEDLRRFQLQMVEQGVWRVAVGIPVGTPHRPHRTEQGALHHSAPSSSLPQRYGIEIVVDA